MIGASEILHQHFRNYDFLCSSLFGIVINFVFFFIATVIVSCSVFWFFNILLMILDLTGRPQCLLRYKIQEGKNQPVCLTSRCVCFTTTHTQCWVVTNYM